jgi:hypothetical protein
MQLAKDDVNRAYGDLAYRKDRTFAVILTTKLAVANCRNPHGRRLACLCCKSVSMKSEHNL